MAKIIRKVVFSGGKEGQLEGLSKYYLIISIIGFFSFIIIWIVNGFSAIWLTYGFLCLIQGITLYILINAGAEIIRLLKMQNGLNFCGKISEPKSKLKYLCSNCNNVVEPDEQSCPFCDKIFVIENDDI